jgi:hypothetical protein
MRSEQVGDQEVGVRLTWPPLVREITDENHAALLLTPDR